MTNKQTFIAILVGILILTGAMLGLFIFMNGSTKPKSTVKDTPHAHVTAEALQKNNGKNGAKCWVAVSGNVYDVTDNNEWANGQHLPSHGLASCGRDLTKVIEESPHGKQVLGDLPAVGQIH